MDLVQNKDVDYFRENGFAIIQGFLTAEEVRELKTATEEVVGKYCQNSPICIFEHQSKDTYFAESGDKIRGFFEEGAVDKNGHLITEQPAQALNKIGHALHKFHPTFVSKTISPKVKDVVNKLTNIKKPVVMQSMVIFKHPKVGGIVKPHQDASYLYMEPSPGSLIGFWIALDEASLENGCLHFLPGSHKDGKVHQRFVRNPDKSSDTLFVHQGENVPVPSPQSLVAAPAKPGDLVLIDGLVIHQSAPNTSSKPRMAYTFHVMDASTKYSSENWLQPTTENTFVDL